jgi:sensor domain CHASE-containing protein
MPKKATHTKIKDLEKKITIIAVMIVAALIGAYTLGFSFAASSLQ